MDNYAVTLEPFGDYPGVAISLYHDEASDHAHWFATINDPLLQRTFTYRREVSQEEAHNDPLFFERYRVAREAMTLADACATKGRSGDIYAPYRHDAACHMVDVVRLLFPAERVLWPAGLHLDPGLTQRHARIPRPGRPAELPDTTLAAHGRLRTALRSLWLQVRLALPGGPA